MEISIKQLESLVTEITEQTPLEMLACVLVKLGMTTDDFNQLTQSKSCQMSDVYKCNLFVQMRSAERKYKSIPKNGLMKIFASEIEKKVESITKRNTTRKG